MFEEKSKERYKGKEIAVWQMPRYKESKKIALKIIKEYDSIEEGDFWILKNYIKSTDQMGYSGLIISHNGCLKLNDTLSEEMRFKPSCVTVDKQGYGGSLVFTYCSDEQGLYEVGEFSQANSSQPYPYAMAFKRMFDRVILKLTKLAYGGIYSEVEADEFRAPEPDAPKETKKTGARSNDKGASSAEEGGKALRAYHKRLQEEGVVKGSLTDFMKQAGWDGKNESIDDDLIGKTTMILMECETAR